MWRCWWRRGTAHPCGAAVESTVRKCSTQGCSHVKGGCGHGRNGRCCGGWHGWVCRGTPHGAPQQGVALLVGGLQRMPQHRSQHARRAIAHGTRASVLCCGCRGCCQGWWILVWRRCCCVVLCMCCRLLPHANTRPGRPAALPAAAAGCALHHHLWSRTAGGMHTLPCQPQRCGVRFVRRASLWVRLLTLGNGCYCQAPQEARKAALHMGSYQLSYPRGARPVGSIADQRPAAAPDMQCAPPSSSHLVEHVSRQTGAVQRGWRASRVLLSERPQVSAIAGT